MISLLLHQSEAKPRMSVNNKDIIRMYLGYNWLITQRLYQSMLSFVISKQWLQVMFTYQSFFCHQLFIPLIFSPVIFTYHPRNDK